MADADTAPRNESRTTCPYSPELVLETVKTYTEVHLLVGFGSTAKYLDIGAVIEKLAPHLTQIQQRAGNQPWLLLYGGDRVNTEAPDTGLLVQQVKEKWTNCRVMAPLVKTEGGPKECEPFVNHCYVMKPEYKADLQPVQPPHEAAGGGAGYTHGREGAGGGSGGAVPGKRGLPVEVEGDGGRTTQRHHAWKDQPSADGSGCGCGVVKVEEAGTAPGVATASGSQQPTTSDGDMVGLKVPTSYIGAAAAATAAATFAHPPSCETANGGDPLPPPPSAPAGPAEALAEAAPPAAAVGTAAGGAPSGGRGEVLWGGIRNGRPVGPSRLYLHDSLLGESVGGTPRIKSVLAAGGGKIVFEELKYAAAKGVPWVYIKSSAGDTSHYGEFGPVDAWAEEQQHAKSGQEREGCE